MVDGLMSWKWAECQLHFTLLAFVLPLPPYIIFLSFQSRSLTTEPILCLIAYCQLMAKLRLQPCFLTKSTSSFCNPCKFIDLQMILEVHIMLCPLSSNGKDFWEIKGGELKSYNLTYLITLFLVKCTSRLRLNSWHHHPNMKLTMLMREYSIIIKSMDSGLRLHLGSDSSYYLPAMWIWVIYFMFFSLDCNIGGGIENNNSYASKLWELLYKLNI